MAEKIAYHTKNLASLESQSNQLIAPDVTQINIDLNLEKQASTSSWVLGNKQLFTSPTLSPGNGQAHQEGAMAWSEATGLSQLSSHPSDTTS